MMCYLIVLEYFRYFYIRLPSFLGYLEGLARLKPFQDWGPKWRKPLRGNREFHIVRLGPNLQVCDAGCWYRTSCWFIVVMLIQTIGDVVRTTSPTTLQAWKQGWSRSHMKKQNKKSTACDIETWFVLFKLRHGRSRAKRQKRIQGTVRHCCGTSSTSPMELSPFIWVPIQLGILGFYLPASYEWSN